MIPVPSKTVGVYGHVFGVVAMLALGTSVVCFALVPLLKRWMHEEPVEPSKVSKAEPAPRQEPAMAE